MARSEDMPGPDGAPVRTFYRVVGQLRAGDWLPDYGAHITGAPVTDPDDGSVWVPLDTGVDVRITRRKAWVYRVYDAPAWVRDALDCYRDARHAWEALRESSTPVPTTVPGASGGNVVCYQLEADDFRRAFPPPRFADYVRAAAHAQRRPEEVTTP